MNPTKSLKLPTPKKEEMALKNSHRMDRIERELRELSSQFFIQSGKRLGESLLTVSRVSVSKDIRHAHIYVSLLGPDETSDEFDEIKELERELGFHLGRNLSTKYTPKVSIHLDSSIAETMELQNKINKVSKEQN